MLQYFLSLEYLRLYLALSTKNNVNRGRYRENQNTRLRLSSIKCYETVFGQEFAKSLRNNVVLCKDFLFVPGQSLDVPLGRHKKYVQQYFFLNAAVRGSQKMQTFVPWL